MWLLLLLSSTATLLPLSLCHHHHHYHWVVIIIIATIPYYYSINLYSMQKLSLSLSISNFTTQLTVVTAHINASVLLAESLFSRFNKLLPGSFATSSPKGFSISSDSCSKPFAYKLCFTINPPRFDHVTIFVHPRRIVSNKVNIAEQSLL